MKTIIDTVAPAAPVEAYAVEMREGYDIFSEEVTAFALKQLAAGVQTRDGERNLERLLNSL